MRAFTRILYLEQYNKTTLSLNEFAMTIYNGTRILAIISLCIAGIAIPRSALADNVTIFVFRNLNVPTQCLGVLKNTAPMQTAMVDCKNDPTAQWLFTLGRYKNVGLVQLGLKPIEEACLGFGVETGAVFWHAFIVNCDQGGFAGFSDWEVCKLHKDVAVWGAQTVDYIKFTPINRNIYPAATNKYSCLGLHDEDGALKGVLVRCTDKTFTWWNGCIKSQCVDAVPQRLRPFRIWAGLQHPLKANYCTGGWE